MVKVLSPIGACVLVGSGLGLSTDALAVTFNFHSETETPEFVLDGFNQAGELWSSFLADDITIEIEIAFTDTLSDAVLGTTSTAESVYQYEDFYTALLSTGTSADDQLSISSLPSEPDFDVLINYTRDHAGLLAEGVDPETFDYSLPYLDSNGGRNNHTLRVTHANAKALGLLESADSVENAFVSTIFDGSITLNSLYNWDWDRADGIAAGEFDFVGVAAHELGHILGFTSGVDILDINSPFTTPNGMEFFFPEDSFPYVSPLDLFRFSEESLAYGPGVIDWTAGATEKYFSIDGGNTPIANFSTGAVQGDGYSAGHWQVVSFQGLDSEVFPTEPIGIMDPDIALEELLQVSAIDLRAFDVIGWTLTDAALDFVAAAMEVVDIDSGDSVVVVDGRETSESSGVLSDAGGGVVGTSPETTPVVNPDITTDLPEDIGTGIAVAEADPESTIEIAVAEADPESTIEIAVAETNPEPTIEIAVAETNPEPTVPEPIIPELTIEIPATETTLEPAIEIDIRETVPVVREESNPETIEMAGSETSSTLAIATSSEPKVEVPSSETSLETGLEISPGLPSTIDLDLESQFGATSVQSSNHDFGNGGLSGSPDRQIPDPAAVPSRDIVLASNIQAVPGPSSVVGLLLGGLLGTQFLRRKKTKSAG